MRVIISGGDGFIASTLADRLLAQGHQVCSLDNYATGQPNNLPSRAGLTKVTCSIWAASALRAAFDDFGPTHVVHAAASYKDPDDWQEDARTNVLGTANVVKATQRAGLDRLIYFQTSLCYGTRPDTQPITLDHPVRPSSSYAITKTAGEQLIEMALPNYVSFRLANCYGPRNLSGPLPAFFRRLEAGEKCTVADARRDFVFVDDLIELVMKALQGRGHGKYHVSSGEDYSIAELFGLVTKAMDIDSFMTADFVPRGADDAQSILLDPSRTQQDFGGWRVSTPLHVGVERAVEWYREHGVAAAYTHLRMPEEAKAT